ncbi:BlaI/MecI/CopY family transcriptional regulator, partial [Streptomyces europaeiscabiei]|uniref:BlaI/MecI/CopY family transcriptional regulator n=1 Tax=Streptomyces europaeiscabiei TaxID=146819 RepID=UPI0038F7357A
EATAKATAAKAAQPTLVELIHRHLAEQGEPRSAAEIATSLGQAHPDRNIKTTVVRTTVEGLVAKSHAQRTKQGSSVYYTATGTEPAATTPAPAQDQPETN